MTKVVEARVIGKASVGPQEDHYLDELIVYHVKEETPDAWHHVLTSRECYRNGTGDHTLPIGGKCWLKIVSGHVVGISHALLESGKC